MKIAVVGAGISGIVSSWVLSKKHEITLFEKEDRLGGHTNTRVLTDGPDAGLAIDTGFIVCNPKNYPNFYNFINLLGLSFQDSDMSFGFWSVPDRLQYVGPAPRDFLKAPQNFLRRDFLQMAYDQRRFNKAMLLGIRNDTLADVSLSDYICKLKLSAAFVDFYLTPLIGAIWSSPEADVGQFPAKTFATFFNNHGMLNLGTFSKWQTIVGGSHSYLKAFEQKFTGTIRKGIPVSRVERVKRSESGKIKLELLNQEILDFDAIVFATHADQTLKILSDLSSSERAALENWRYTKNKATLHTDATVMPKNRKLWAAWNYQKNDISNQQVQITYYMNRLQNLAAKDDYFVTLNQQGGIDPSKIIYEVDYEHPVYTPESITTQSELRQLNGQLNTYFAGAYLGYGFHEDGVKSALAVTQHFGLGL